mgnify:CR=1 FL=1
MQEGRTKKTPKRAGSRFSHEGLTWRNTSVTGLLVVVTLACLVWISDREVRSDIVAETGLLLHENNVTHEVVLKNSLQRLRRDVIFLSNTPPVLGLNRAHGNDGYDARDAITEEVWKQRLQEIFSAYLHAHPTATQVRYIGVESGGKEVIRVDQRDGNIVVTQPDKLQVKGGRSYFLETVRRKGDVYISDINLNRENGSVADLSERTIRAGIAVNDVRGGIAGIVIINTSADQILNSLASEIDANFNSYLLNENGYFINNSEVNKEGRSGSNEKDLVSSREQSASWSDVLPEILTKGDIAAVADGSTQYAEFNDQKAYFSVKALPFDEMNKQRVLYFVTAVPSQRIEDLVSKVRRTTIYSLLSISVLVLIFLYIVSLSIKRRELVNLKNSEIAAIVNHSPDAIIGLSSSGFVTSWNPGAEEMFGYTVGEAVGQSVLDLIVEEGRREEEVYILGEARRGSVIPHVEVRRRCKNGRLIHVEMTVSPVISEQGDVIGVANICRDTSPLKEAQRRILEVNASLEKTVTERTAELAALVSVQHAILDGAGYAIIATDIDGRITHFNPAAEVMLGYRADEAIGKLTPGAFHDATEVIERAKVLSKELGFTVKPGMDSVTTKPRMGISEELEWTFRRKDGSRFPVLLKVTVLSSEDGRVEGFLGIAMDLTLRKEAQKELIEAKENADRANRAKSDFLANMSHEIRTPMNAVIGMLQLIKSTPLSDKQADYVDKSRGAAKSLLLILNDILDLSKIESGKMLLDPISFSIDSLLKDVATIISIGVAKKPVEIVFEISPDVPSMVIGDSLRIQQILINIAGNAVKFTSRGEVVISIDLISSADDEVRLGFSVRDTGIGMTPEQQDKLFNSFSQAEAGTTRRFGGTGLGLVISKRLVHLMNGELELESHAGIGSTFSFSLLLQRSEDDEHLTEQIADEMLLKLRVLILDDNDVARAAIAQLAESLGWVAATASDSDEALRLIEEAVRKGEPYQVAFVDWFLPNAGAKALLPGLSKLATECSVDMSVIAMTPAHLSEQLADDIAAGGLKVDGAVNKPLTPSDLLDAASDVLLTRHRRSVRSGSGSGLQSDALFGLNILLVEDNVNNQQVAKELMEMAGGKVTIAEDGIVAVDILRDDGFLFDVVLMDIQMPRMDGYAATGKIRKELGLVDLPIIAMTANAMPNDRQACFDAGMNEHVGKPFEVDNLIGVILTSVSETPPSKVSVLRASQAPSEKPASKTANQGDDFPAALKRFNNDETFFCRHARGFVSRYAQGLTAIEKTLKDADHEAFFREIHSLKGLAATVGASQLERYLKEVEQYDKSDLWVDAATVMLPVADTLLLQAKESLTQFVDELSAAVKEDDRRLDIHPDGEGSAEQLTRKMDRLERHLGTVNMESLSVYEELKSALPFSWDIDLSLLEAAVYELDFDSAASHLDRVRQQVAAKFS